MQSLGALLKSAVTYLAPELREEQRRAYARDVELRTWRATFFDRSYVEMIQVCTFARMWTEALAEDRERYESKMLALRSCYRGSVVRCLRAVGLPLTEAAALELVHADALQEDAERDVRRAVA